MDVFEHKLFYGRKVHPSNSMMGDADFANMSLSAKPAAIAPIVDAPTGKGLTAMVGSSNGKPIMGEYQAPPTGIVGDGKPSMVVETGAKPTGGHTYAEPQPVTPTPAPTSTTPMMGSFPWPQQGGYYPEAQPNNNKTLIMVAVGIAALGVVIYFVKNR